MRFGLVLGFLFLPVIALAAETGFFGPVVPPCTEYGGAVPICQACNLVQLADNILRVFVSLAVMIAALMFAYAGILYVTAAANQQNLESAKKIFWNVLIGLIFVLAAFLIVDLVLRVLTKQSFNVLTKIQCVKLQTTNGVQTMTEVRSQNPVSGTQGASGSSGVTGTGGVPCTQVTGTTAYFPGIGDLSMEGGDITSRGGVPYTVQDCLDDIKIKRACKPITVASTRTGRTPNTPYDTTFAWPELIKKYNQTYGINLPQDTQFKVDDVYAARIQTKTFDVAQCAAHNTTCFNKNMQGGSFSDVGSPQCQQ